MNSGTGLSALVACLRASGVGLAVRLVSAMAAGITSDIRAQADSLFPLPLQRLAWTSSKPPMLADMDGDGLGDFILPVEDAAKIGVRYAQPDGTYEKEAIASVGPLQLRVADVTGDGLNDFVALKPAGTIRVTPVVGRAHFGDVIDSLGAGGIQDAALLLGDVIEDGQLDAAVLDAKEGGQSCVGCLRLFTGQGDGTFDFVSTQPTNVLYERQLLDVDGDGHLDLVGLTDAGASALRLAVRRGFGDGTFAASVPTLLEIEASSPSFADVDGDGLLDLAIATVSEQLDSQLRLYRNEGTGAFTSQLTVDLVDPTGFSNLFSPVLGDVVEDGQPDVTMTSFAVDGQAILLDDLIVYPAIAPFALGAPMVVPTPGYVGNLSLHDIDHDGHLDVVANVSGGRAGCWLGNGAGSFVAPGVVETGVATSEVAADDFDGDGDADVLATTLEPGGLTRMLGDGLGSFGSSTQFIEFATADQLKTGDVDGDGDIDAVLSAVVGTVAVLDVARNASGSFAFGPVVLVGGVADVALADVDLDGILDVVISRSDSAAVEVLHGNGSGGLVAAGQLPVASIPSGVVAADIDSDGHVDVLCALPADDAVAVFFDVVGGPTLLSSPGADQPALDDLDDDGDLDLVVAAASVGAVEPNLRIYDNSASWFALSQEIAAIDALRGVAFADVNRDGLRDIVCGAKVPLQLDGLVIVVPGVPEGVKATPRAFGTVPLAWDIATADFDHDGYTDAVVSSRATGSIGLLLNRSDAWETLGYSLAAPGGTPLLKGEGKPVVGESVSLSTTGAPSPALGWLIAGVHAAYAPAKSGFVVPSADFVIGWLPNTTLATTWPPGIPAGMPICLQAWFTAQGNFSATNALVVSGK